MSEPELYSPEAEEAVLGSVLINPVTFATLGLDAGQFFLERSRVIWQAYTRLYSAGVAIDLVTVCDELERAGTLKLAGGQAYFAKIINATPSSLNAEHYAASIKDYAQRRAWRAAAGEIAKLVFDKDSDLSMESANVIDQLLGAVRIDGAAVHISEVAQRVYDKTLQRIDNPKDVWGLQSGFDDFDFITGGLQLGEVLDVSGEPGIGKSIFVMQMAFQLAAASQPGSIYSLEMKDEAVMRRRISHDAKVPTRALKSGYMDEQQKEQFFKNIGSYDSLPLFISDNADLSTVELRADLTRLKLQHGITWFAVDYAFLLRDGEGLNDTERTGLISKRLKSICRALDLAGIVIHSMTKEGMAALIPEGHHLRGSAQVFYDADVLLFMVEGNTPQLAKFIFGKGRELENPRKYFELVKLQGFPALGNLAKTEGNNGKPAAQRPQEIAKGA